MTENKWIQKAINPQKKGSLRKSLGVKKGKNIPAKELKAAAKGKGIPAKRAKLAETLKCFKKK